MTTLTGNPRLTAPTEVIRALAHAAVAPNLAFVIDVDAVARRTVLERPLVLALDALAHTGVQLFLVSRNREPPRMIGRATCLGPGDSPIAAVRMLAPSARLIVIGDDAVLFEALEPRDRGLVLGRYGHVLEAFRRMNLERSNVVEVGELAVRAALWWIVETRDRERRNSDPALGSVM